MRTGPGEVVLTSVLVPCPYAHQHLEVCTPGASPAWKSPAAATWATASLSQCGKDESPVQRAEGTGGKTRQMAKAVYFLFILSFSFAQERPEGSPAACRW